MSAYTESAVNFSEDFLRRESRMYQTIHKTAEDELREQVEANGHKFLKINWKKRTIHFLDENGNKHVQVFNPRD